MAEPVLQEQAPAPFAAIQGLVTLFYFLPGYLAVAWGLMTNPGQRWLQDLAVILAGASFHVSDYSYVKMLMFPESMFLYSICISMVVQGRGLNPSIRLKSPNTRFLEKKKQHWMFM